MRSLHFVPLEAAGGFMAVEEEVDSLERPCQGAAQILQSSEPAPMGSRETSLEGRAKPGPGTAKPAGPV